MNNIEKLVSILANPATDLENALEQLRLYRFVDSAEGIQLDVIGAIVGQPRNGMIDASYRRYIRARISTNNSDGTFEELLTIAYLVVYDVNADYVLTNEGSATVRLRVASVALDTTDTNADGVSDLAAVLYAFMLAAVSAGIRIVVQWSNYVPAQTFTLDTGPGLDSGHLANALG